jgi:MOSC domain-containing protein YiiM
MSTAFLPRALAELEAQLDALRAAPKDRGALEMIVRRPATGEREELQHAELDLVQGLVGDNWLARGSAKTPDGKAHPEKQLNLMGARVVALLAQDRARWPLAGDQLYVDLDLSLDNLPPGSRLLLSEAVIEVTPPPHTGCAKFVERFGVDAMKFVNSPTGRALNLRGVNAKVVTPGRIRRGDAITVLSRP